MHKTTDMVWDIDNKNQGIPAAVMHSEAEMSLCTTCINFEHCSLHKLADEPVLQCNEFTCINGYEKTVKARVLNFTDRHYTEPVDMARGLCTNCLNTGICGLAKPDTGVWHCEEYR